MDEMSEKRIRIVPDGSYRVSGAPAHRTRMITNEAGRPVEWARGGDLQAGESYSLCRCGASENKPFCDGTHKQIDFDGTETADRTPTATRREAYEGPGIVMTDDKPLCYHAGFCVTEHEKAWSLVAEAADPDARERLVGMIRNCPSGRLEYYEPPDESPVAEDLDQEIAVVDDGPLWVRGGIAIESADGETYEVRNRVTLCRCGASENKPYCDGAHSKIGFTDS